MMTCNDIMQVAARYFGVRVCDLIGPGRSKSLIRARHITMAVVREVLDMSYPEIAQEFGGRDHSSAMNAVKRARVKRMQIQSWAEAFNGIERALLPWREEAEIEKLEIEKLEIGA